MPEQSVVAGYNRVSLARDNMHAPELYEHEITRYCTYRSITLGHIYSDIDHSAFRGAPSRPALEELVSKRQSYARSSSPNRPASDAR